MFLSTCFGFCQQMSNNSTLSLLSEREAESALLISLVWPGQLMCLLDSLLNVVIAIVVIYLFSKWKVYEGELKFLLPVPPGLRAFLQCPHCPHNLLLSGQLYFWQVSGHFDPALQQVSGRGSSSNLSERMVHNLHLVQPLRCCGHADEIWRKVREHFLRYFLIIIQLEHIQ